MNKDRRHLHHVLECIARIDDYTSEGEEVFLSDAKTQDAPLRNLQPLAESTQRLSDELKGRYAAIDWRSIAGFRNIVVHNYLGFDLTQIWAIIEEDLLLLKQAIRAMLEDVEGL